MTTLELRELKIKTWRDFKKEKAEWRPIFRGRGYPTNDNLQASIHQLNKIYLQLDGMGIDAYAVVFILNNRADGIRREKRLFDLNKGDAWDVIQAIKKNRVKELIKV